MAFDHNNINDFRQRVIKGEHVDEEELKAAIAYLADVRSGVASSAAVAAKPKSSSPRKTKAQASKDAKNLLGDLL